MNEEDDDDENNVHEQRLKRAKEYIEQIAKQGEHRHPSAEEERNRSFCFLEQERELDRDVVSDRLRDDVVSTNLIVYFSFLIVRM
jgi:hypothetical protein